MKNLKKLGKVLGKKEQKSIVGGCIPGAPCHPVNTDGDGSNGGTPSEYHRACITDANCPPGQTCILPLNPPSTPYVGRCY